MSNELQVINLLGGALAIPEHLRNAPSIVGDIPTGDTRTRVGLKGRDFHIIRGGVEEGTVPTKHLDVILIGAVPHISRTYFPGAYVEGVATAPSCYSVDGNVPAPDVRFPQSEKCMSCPQNVEGSSLTGDRKGKACGFFRRVALLLRDYDQTTPFQMDIKSMGLWGEDGQNGQYGFQEYAKKLKAHNVDAGHVVTRLTFDPSVGVPKLLFQAAGFIDAEELARVSEFVQSGAVAETLKISMATFDGGNLPVVPEQTGEPAKPIQQPAQTAPKPTPQARPVAAPTPVAEDVPQAMPIKKPTLLKATTPAPTAQPPAPKVLQPRVVQQVPMPQEQGEMELTDEQARTPPAGFNYPPQNRQNLAPLRPTRVQQPAAQEAPPQDDSELESLLSELNG